MASTYRGGNGGPAAWEPPDYDVVGVDGYNRYPCKPVAPRTFVQLFSPTRTFAISRGKPFAIGEFGCVEQNACGASGDPNGKAAWISAAAAALKTWPEAIFACYSHVTTVEGYDYWMDTSSSSLASFRAMALDPYFAGTSVIAP